MVFEYAPAPESTKIVNLKSNYDLFIGGKFVKSKTKYFMASFVVLIPPAGFMPILRWVAVSKSLIACNITSVTGRVAASQKDVDEAVKAARKAFKSWSKLSGSERGKYLYRLARIIQERSRELAVLESMNNGKPIRESRDIDIPLVAAHFFCGRINCFVVWASFTFNKFSTNKEVIIGFQINNFGWLGSRGVFKNH